MKVLRIIFSIVVFICFVAALKTVQPSETNLLSAFISSETKEAVNLIKLSQLSNNQVNIIFEADNTENAEKLKALFENKLSKLKTSSDTEKSVIAVHKNYPVNFLTSETRKLLKHKNYDEIEKQSLERLYNPLGFFIAPVDKDPYLFSVDFLMNNQKYFFEDYVEYEGKIYSLTKYEVNNGNDIEYIKNTVSELEKENYGKIYLSGTPVHTFETQKKSSFEINIICILSTLMVVFLCRFFIGSFKILIPIILSILFGVLFGFTFSALIFKKLHILTFVFATSLIGISLDYSLHYYLSADNKNFKKSLLTSLLSTIITFGTLYFSNIDVLKQIAVFVSFGLTGVYAFVCLITPLFKEKTGILNNIKFLDLSRVKAFKTTFLCIISFVLLLGLFNLKFDDSIKNLYKPNKLLLKAETVYKNIFNTIPVNFIIVEGDGVDEIIKTQEKIKENLCENGIKNISLSDFVQSKDRQKENINLVKELYQNNLNKYGTFLNEWRKKELLTSNQEIFNPSEYPLKKKFMLDDRTSFIIAFVNEVQGFKLFNITSEMTKILKNFRHKCLTLIPLIFIVLYLVLRCFYTTKETIKIITPSFLGGIFALLVQTLFGVSLNIFHLLAFILGLGFSMDYSIFGLSGDKNSSTAIFISCLSTALSFLMLAFTSFKLISSLGLTLSLGILASYLLSLIFIKNTN